MAKPNTPLLSLEAHGTIGNALTHQGRGRVKIAREKPRLPYSLTLAQQYQRWLYEDYAYLWRQQSEAIQATYRTAGVRFHLTGFQYWMKYQLANLPDIAGWWKLDEKGGVVAYDSSKNANNGTIVGATPVSGLIDGALYFDGLNDQVWAPTSPSLELTDLITLECLITPETVNQSWRFIAGKPWGGSRALSSYALVQRDTVLYWIIASATGWQQITFTPPLVAGQSYHVLCLLTTTHLYIYVDGAFGTARLRTETPRITNAPFRLGLWWTIAYFRGDIDNCILYNRNLDTTEILRHSLRRWPQ